MATATQLMNEALAYVQSPDDTEANDVALAGLNDAIRLLDSKNWGWALMQTSITLTATNRTFDLPADFRAPRNMELLDASNNPIGMLGYKDPKSFLVSRVDYAQTAPGDPTYYTVTNNHETNDVELDVAPSSAFVAKYAKARLWYYRTTTRLVTGTDTLDTDSSTESFVMWQAAAYVASRFDPEKLGYAQSRADRAWQQMCRAELRDFTSDWS